MGSSDGGAAEGSHLEVVPPGPNILSDSLIGTSIFGLEAGVGGAGGGGEGGGGEDYEFGIDPAADPELAFALRMSLEEEKARLERENNQAGGNAENAGKMEGIEEEGKPAEEGDGGEGKPLLDKKEDGKDKDNKDGDDHKMDTA